MTNVLGDALAAGIIAHIFRKEFAPKVTPKKHESRSVWSTEGGGWFPFIFSFLSPPLQKDTVNERLVWAETASPPPQDPLGQGTEEAPPGQNGHCICEV